MTDIEFDVLDELYFVTSFELLAKQVGLPEQILKDTLYTMLQKGWIKCFKTASEELPVSELQFDSAYRHYYFLATKAGLLAHNSK
jgi:hypothetical protein